MLNGVEKSLERHLPGCDRGWLVEEAHTDYGNDSETHQPGGPKPLNPEHAPALPVPAIPGYSRNGVRELKFGTTEFTMLGIVVVAL